MFAYTKLQQSQVGKVFTFGNPYPIAKISDAFRCVPPATHATYCRHAWIIPAIHVFFVDKLQELPFTHYRIRKITARKFILVRRIYLQFFDQPVIQLAMRHEFHGTNRMCNILDTVTLPVSEIIHWIDTPFVTGLVMTCMLDTVKQGVPHEHIGVSHVDLCPQRMGTIRKITFLHSFKQTKILFHVAVT